MHRPKSKKGSICISKTRRSTSLSSIGIPLPRLLQKKAKSKRSSPERIHFTRPFSKIIFFIWKHLSASYQKSKEKANKKTLLILLSVFRKFFVQNNPISNERCLQLFETSCFKKYLRNFIVERNGSNQCSEVLGSSSIF